MDPIGMALAAVADVWDEVSETPYTARDLGLPVDRLPEISEAATQETSARAKALLAVLDELDVDALPHELALTVEVARAQMQLRAPAGDWYWLVYDPLGC